MLASALRFPPVNLTPGAVARGLFAGLAWGVLFTAGWTTMTFLTCGVVCLDVVAVTAAMAMTGGLLTIGPLVVLTGRPAGNGQ